VLWELVAGVLKSAPSGDVDPMAPGVSMLVCATLRPMPTAEMAKIAAAARKDLIWMTVRPEV